jgi:hypothetical protein
VQVVVVRPKGRAPLHHHCRAALHLISCTTLLDAFILASFFRLFDAPGSLQFVE